MKEKQNFVDFLFDLFQDSMRSSDHKYLLNAQIAESIKERAFLHPLDFPGIRSKLLGNKKTENVLEFLQKSGAVEDLKFAHWYLRTLELPEYVADSDYLPLKFWVKPREVVEDLDTLIIESSRKGIASSSIVYLGEKGSRKSHTINCWLAENKERLNTEKILWLYADGYKLYEIWKSQDADEQRLVTVDEFLKLRLVYVIAKYREKSAFLGDIYHKIVRSSLAIPIVKKTGSMMVEKNIQELFEQFSKDIKGYEIGRAHFKGIEAEYYTYLLREAQRRGVAFAKAKERWLALARVTESFLLSEGYKILKVLDGMDNINIEAGGDRAKRLYSRALDQCYDFISRETENVIKVLVVRERTFIDIFQKSLLAPERPSGRLEMQLVKIWQPSQDLETIYRRRVRFALQDSAFSSSELYRFVKEQLRLYYETMKRQLPPWLSSDLFHNNVSNFLYNTFTLFLLLYYRWLQQGKPDLEKYDISSQLAHYFSRNLFLNGRFFLDSRVMSPNLSKVGTFAFSPFYVDIRYLQKNPSSSLVHIFLLHLLDQEMELTEEEVLQTLSCGEYSEDLIKESIERCREYGLVDTLMGKRKNVYIKTSAKGKSLLGLIFSSLDLLYIFSLDSYVPKIFLEKGYIRPYNNKILESGAPIKTRYAASAIKSSVVFLSYLLQLGNAEGQKFVEESRCPWSPSTSFVSLEFPLPIPLSSTRRLVERFRRLYNAASQDEKKEINDFFEEIKRRAR